MLIVRSRSCAAAGRLDKQTSPESYLSYLAKKNRLVSHQDEAALFEKQETTTPQRPPYAVPPPC